MKQTHHTESYTIEIRPVEGAAGIMRKKKKKQRKEEISMGNTKGFGNYFSHFAFVCVCVCANKMTNDCPYLS